MNRRFQKKAERDLFEQPQAGEDKRAAKAPFAFPRLKNSITLSCENSIVFIIGFVMACIIFFSLGVEKGRRDTSYMSQRVGMGKSILSIPKDTSALTKEAAVTKKLGAYVVQLASFKKKESADQEREKLQREGYRADIRRSGDYYKVYIGAYEKINEAQGLSAELKGRYADCYVERLR